MLGKIHGLENIALLSQEEVEACHGNPVALQHAINNVKFDINETKTYEQKVNDF